MRHPTLGILLIAIAAGCNRSPASYSRMQDGMEVQTTSRWTAVTELSDTGLYADIGAKTLAAGVMRYSPAYELWSDGLEKARFVSLPPGATIDTRDIDAWQFPAGTRLWKEFARRDPETGTRRLIETRLLAKDGDGAWTYGAYLWSEDQATATLVSPLGHADAGEIGAGVMHDIPAFTDCQYCHENSGTEVLGFSAVQLASAAHGVTPAPRATDEVTLERLIAAQRLSHPPVAAVEIMAADDEERDVIGYLHGNCGHCHNPRSHVSGVRIDYSYALARIASRADLPILGDIGRIADTPGVQIPGVFTPDLRLIDLDNAEHSMMLFRVAGAETPDRMPRIGAKVRDQEFIRKLRAWIVGLAP